MDRLEAENELLRAALHQAQWTVEFLHGCLTQPSLYSYNYPIHTMTQLAEWHALSPPPDLCPHSRFDPECRPCVAGREWQKALAKARAVVAAG
jgi:hypothetical protein